MNDDDKPDNVVQFTPRNDSIVIPADALLEDCVGEYEEVIILGLNADGEMVVTGNISDVSMVYDMLSSAANNLAMAHLEMAFQGTKH